MVIKTHNQKTKYSDSSFSQIDRLGQDGDWGLDWDLIWSFPTPGVCDLATAKTRLELIQWCIPRSQLSRVYVSCA